MADTRTPSAILSAAADLIRDTASAAKDGPWRNHDTWLDAGRYTATVLAGEGNKTKLVAWLPSFESDPADGDGQFRKAWDTARWIALLSPAVAPHIEAWLRCAAEMCNEWDDPMTEAAIAFARSVLGVQEEVSDGS